MMHKKIFFWSLSLFLSLSHVHAQDKNKGRTLGHSLANKKAVLQAISTDEANFKNTNTHVAESGNTVSTVVANQEWTLPLSGAVSGLMRFKLFNVLAQADYTPGTGMLGTQSSQSSAPSFDLSRCMMEKVDTTINANPHLRMMLPKISGAKAKSLLWRMTVDKSIFEDPNDTVYFCVFKDKVESINDNITMNYDSLTYISIKNDVVGEQCVNDNRNGQKVCVSYPLTCEKEYNRFSFFCTLDIPMPPAP